MKEREGNKEKERNKGERDVYTNTMFLHFSCYSLGWEWTREGSNHQQQHRNYKQRHSEHRTTENTLAHTARGNSTTWKPLTKERFIIARCAFHFLSFFSSFVCLCFFDFNMFAGVTVNCGNFFSMSCCLYSLSHSHIDAHTSILLADDKSWWWNEFPWTAIITVAPSLVCYHNAKCDFWISFYSPFCLFKNKLSHWEFKKNDALTRGVIRYQHDTSINTQKHKNLLPGRKSVQMCFEWALSLLSINILCKNVT